VDTPSRAVRRPSSRTVAVLALIVLIVLAALFLYQRYEPSISLNRVLDWYAEYGYWAVFVPVFLETAGLPLPGETSLLLAGVASSTGRIDVFWVIVVGATAAILGDNVGFALGRRLGRRLLSAPGPLHRHRLRVLSVGEPFFDRHGPKAVFLGRWVTGLRITAAWLAGANRMRWPVFVFWNALGGIAWAASVGLLSYYLGHTAERFLKASGLVALGVVVLAAGVLALVLRWRRERGEDAVEKVLEDER
jgi:membrane protein DedA with SNARE-associated domain